jgi:hypothetical protein
MPTKKESLIYVNHKSCQPLLNYNVNNPFSILKSAKMMPFNQKLYLGVLIIDFFPNFGAFNPYLRKISCDNGALA